MPTADDKKKTVFCVRHAQSEQNIATARIAAGDWALEGRRDAVISRVPRAALKCTVRVGDGAEREVAAALTPILITALHPRREEVVVAGELGARSGAVVDVTSAVAGLADTPGERAVEGVTVRRVIS